MGIQMMMQKYNDFFFFFAMMRLESIVTQYREKSSLSPPLNLKQEKELQKDRIATH